MTLETLNILALSRATSYLFQHFILLFAPSSGQITVLIFFHLGAALVTTRLHRPYQLFNSHFVRYKATSLVSHVRIANNIQAFLVKKQYGISYNMLGMTFGLVSMAAFLKVCATHLCPPCPPPNLI